MPILNRKAGYFTANQLPFDFLKALIERKQLAHARKNGFERFMAHERTVGQLFGVDVAMGASAVAPACRGDTDVCLIKRSSFMHNWTPEADPIALARQRTHQNHL